MLAGLYKWVKRYLFDGSLIIPDDELVCEFDVEKIASELLIESAAVKDGSHDLPLTDSTAVSGAEAKIDAYVHKRMADASNIANGKLCGFNVGISSSDLESISARFENKTKDTMLRFRSMLAEAKEDLTSLKHARDKAFEELKRFKKEHERKNKADYPDSKVLYFSLVAVLLLVESLANAYFFAKGSELGILGGISQSIVVASLNIIPAFIIAGTFLLRYRNHVNTHIRRWALLALPIYFFAIVVLNLVVAHYRDLLAINPKEAGSLALDHFLSSPFALTDIDSWLLFLMGVFFSIMAAVDGYKSDDTYPDYGKKTRREEDIAFKFTDEIRRFLSHADSLRKTHKDDLEQGEDDAKKSVEHLEHLIYTKRSLIQKYKNCVRVIASGATALVRKYRDENSIHRKTACPSYFSAAWDNKETYELEGIDDDAKFLEIQKHVLAEIPGRAQQYSNQIEELYLEMISLLEELDPSQHYRQLLKRK